MTKLRLCLSASYGILTFPSVRRREMRLTHQYKRVGDRLARPWMQELLWVRRDDNGEIVRVSQDPPKEGDFIPTVSVKRVNSKPKKKK